MMSPESKMKQHQPILAFKSPSEHSRHQDSDGAGAHAHLFQKTLPQGIQDCIIYSVLCGHPQRRSKDISMHLFQIGVSQ